MQEKLKRHRGSELRCFRPLDERARKRGGVERRGDSDMRGLAKLARGIVLSAIVNVSCGENDEQECAQGESERQKDSGVAPQAPDFMPLRQSSPPRINLDARARRFVSAPASGPPRGPRHYSPGHAPATLRLLQVSWL